MDDTAKYLGIKVNSIPVSEIFSGCDDDKMGHVEEDGLLEGDSASQEKNRKKKKKHKGGLPSPRRIVAFNTAELSKLDEQKADMKANCVVKTLSKSASFPCNAGDVKENYTHVEGSGDSEDSRECAMLSSSFENSSVVLARVSSFPLKSALRGGYEELGKGPRPKLQVTWAPTVWEPPCSTVSHTLNKSSSRKDSKYTKKGKYDAHKRQGKKKHHKSKCDSGGSNTVRRHSSCHNDGGKALKSTSHGDNDPNFSTSGGGRLIVGRPELQPEEGDLSMAKCGSETRTGIDVADDAGLSLNSESNARCGVHYSLESTCAGSLFEPERVACSFLYRQAM